MPDGEVAEVESDTPETTGDPQVQALAGDEGLESGVAIGVVEPSDIPWLRSVWLAVILGIPLAALWIFVATRITTASVEVEGTATEAGDDPTE